MTTEKNSFKCDCSNAYNAVCCLYLFRLYLALAYLGVVERGHRLSSLLIAAIQPLLVQWFIDNFGTDNIRNLPRVA